MDQYSREFIANGSIGLTQTRTMALWTPWSTGRNERSTSIGSQSTGTGSDSSSRRSRAARPPRLVGHGPKNRFYRATRELGRVFKTEFILDYLSQPALRTRIRRGLLKGEQLHALARCVHYGRLGRLDQRDFERQTGAASCLLLILAAIIYWQIREIDRVLSEAGSDADDLNFELLSHISPIGWDNVLLYGEYQLNRSLVRSERLSV